MSGGLGNQMFQYAFYRALQEKNIQCKINVVPNDIQFILCDVFNGLKLQIDTENKYSMYKNPLSFHRYFKEEASGVYDQRVFAMKDTSFLGYWQSEKYFKDICGLIRGEFIFNIRDESLKHFADIIKSSATSVSVHVRRGDYLKLHEIYGGICTAEYYNQAVEYIKSKVENSFFYVFSNDMQWVKDNLRIDNAVYVEATMFDDYQDWYDMYLMSCCKHNIVANSSFSWWGAWLNDNPDKIVVSPNRWQNDADMDDIWCDGWIRVGE
jgi:hypothetical protein